IRSRCIAIIETLGRVDQPKRCIYLVRRRAAALGQRMLLLSRVGLKSPARKALADPVIPKDITEEDFFREIHKCIWDLLDRFEDTQTMDAEERLAALRRHLSMRGRRLELVAKVNVVDYERLRRFVEAEESAKAHYSAT